MRSVILTCAVVFAACGSGRPGAQANDASAGSGGAISMDGGGATAGSGGTPGAASGGASPGGNGGSPSGGAAAGAGGSSGASTAGGAGGTAGSAGGGAGGNGGAGGSGGTSASSDPPCDATCHFVREGATGAGDGSSWTDALTELPQTLERGHRYYVADGSYPGYTFDDAPSGQEAITIIKAAAGRHGTDDGWLAEYGDGAATFGALSVTAPDVVIDGSSDLGFHVVGDFQGSVVDVTADRVTLRHLDVDGAFGTDAGGTQDRGACTGVSIGGSFVRVEHVEIHDVADDGVSASGVEELDFAHNVVHALHACGTDGGCGPCYNGHSDGIEIYDVVRSRFVGNFIYDVRSTSTIFFGNWADSLGNGPSDYCEDIVLANNILYAPEVGLMAYVQDVAGVEILGNVFWGLRQGSYGGLSIGQHITGLRLYDNIILSINTAHTGGAFDAAQDDSDYNLFGYSTGQWAEGPHSLFATDPGFVGIPGVDGPAVTSPTPADFALEPESPAVNAGTPDPAMPTDDFFGAARDAAPDMGAVELP